MLTGENGILNRATTAKQTNEEKQAEEELKLGISALAIDYRKNTTNADSFRDYVMNNKQSLANAMGINKNELTMEPETYTVTYKGQMYIVEADGRLSSYRLIELTGFNIKETTLSIQEGRTEKLTIKNRTPNGANEGIIWTSSDPTIASVDANGLVTGVKQSATTVTITATSKSGNATSSTSCVVTVTEAISEIEEGINPERYGEYVHYNVDLGIDGNFDGIDDGIDDDWRIFYEDSENIYLIAADYVPVNNTYLSTTISRMGAEINTYTDYCFYWKSSEIAEKCKTYKNGNTSSLATGSDDIFVNRPEGTAYLTRKGNLKFWNNSINNALNYAANPKTQRYSLTTACFMDTKNWEPFSAGLPENIQGVAYAIGGPTYSMWVESWNAMYPDNKAYYKVINYGYNGQLNGVPSSDWRLVNLKNTDGYNNTLYFPHRNAYKNTQGYWLASPAGYNGSVSLGAVFASDGLLRNGYSFNNGDVFGARPIVCLPSTATIDKKTNSPVWQIVPLK